MHIRSKEIAYMGMLMAVAIVFILIGCYFDVSTIFFLASASFLAGCVERNLSLVKAMIFVIGTTIIGLILSPQKLYLVTFFGFCVYVLLAERIQEKEEQGQTSFLVKGHIWIKGVVYHAMLVIAVVLMQYLTGLDQIKKSVVYTFFSGHMAVFAIICIVAAELLWVLFDKAYFLFQQQYGHYLKINE